MSKLETNQVDPATGTTLTLGTSGDTIAIPSGVTIANSGTATGFGGANTPFFYGELASDTTLTRSTLTKLTGLTQALINLLYHQVKLVSIGFMVQFNYKL